MLQSNLTNAVFLIILDGFGESVRDEPMIYVASALATSVNSGRAEVQIGEKPYISKVSMTIKSINFENFS